MFRFISFITATVWFSVCLYAMPAYAQGTGKRVRIAVMSHPKRGSITTERAAWVHRLFHWSLGQQARLDVVPLDEMKRRLNAQTISLSPADKARIRVLRTFIGKAKKLYQLGRYQFTLKALQIAEKVAAKVRVHLTKPTLIRELYMYRSLAYMGLRNGLKTREYVMRTVQFDPNFEPSGSLPSSYITYYQVIRKWLLRQRTYQFSIKTVPVGAKVYLNLRYKGQTPISLTVTRGKHLLRLEKPGFSTWERVANFDPRRLKQRNTVSASITLSRDPNSLSLDNIPLFAKGAELDDNILDRLDKICQRLNVKYLYVVSARGAGPYVLHIAGYQRGKRKIRYKRVQIGVSRRNHRVRLLAYARAMGQKIAPGPRPVYRRPAPPRRVVRVEPREEPRRIIPREIKPERRPPPRRVAFQRPEPPPRMERRIPPPTRPPSGTPVHKTWWFWTVTLGTTVAVVATVVVVLTQTGPPPTATLIITTENPTAGN